MSTFAHYARYYDLLYADKDYASEASYVHGMLQRHAPSAASLVEFGCGTGMHAALLAKLGYTVRGIDQSAGMLKAAQARKKALARDVARRLSFSKGDFRSVRFDSAFDAAISLFHVVSYQTGRDDVRGAFDSVRSALKPGGIFVFDVWYGPAVLTDRPAVRVKRLEDDVVQVTRVAEPAIRANEDRVDVDYQVFATDKATGEVQQLRETHRMRYFFQPELEVLLAQSGLTLEHGEEWMTGRPLGFDTWGACFVARA